MPLWVAERGDVSRSEKPLLVAHVHVNFFFAHTAYRNDMHDAWMDNIYAELVTFCYSSSSIFINLMIIELAKLYA